MSKNEENGEREAVSNATSIGNPKNFLLPSRPLLRTASSTSLDIPQANLSRRPSAISVLSTSDVSELSFGIEAVRNEQRNDLFRAVSYTSSSVSQLASPSIWRQKLHEFWVTNYGAFLVLLSQFFGVMMNVSTRLLETTGSHGKAMHPFQILFTRMSITSLLCTVYALWTKSIPHFPFGPPGTVRLLLIARGICGFFGVFGLYFSLVYLPVSEAVVLTFLAPILACYAFSILLPGETFSKQQQLASFISFIGVIFIARPASFFSSSNTSTTSPGAGDGFSAATNGTGTGDASFGPQAPTKSQHLQAVGIAMIGVLGGTAAVTTIRAIGTRAHAFISVNYFSVWSTIVSLVALIFVPSVSFRLPGNLTEWGLLSILGFCGFVMQNLMTVGLAYGGPGTSADQRKQSVNEDLELQARNMDPQISSTVVARGSVVSEALSPRSQPQRRIRSHKSQTTPAVRVSGTRATSMMYTQMLFALAGDKLVWGVVPNAWSWVGSILITAGAIWVAADNSKSKEPEHSQRGGDTTEMAGQSTKTGETAREEEVGLLRSFESDEEESAAQSPSPQGSRSTQPLQDRIAEVT